MLSLATRPSNPLFFHDTNTNTVSFIQPQRSEWTRINLVFPNYIRIYRVETLPPEVRELGIQQHGNEFRRLLGETLDL